MRELCVRCRVRHLPPYGVPLPCLHSVRAASPKTITFYYADPAQPNIGAMRVIDLL